jgi:hypothetical protein
MDHSFSNDAEITRQYRRFSATGTLLTVRLLPPPDSDADDGSENTDADNTDTDPMSHFMASMNDLIDYALKDFAD